MRFLRFFYPLFLLRTRHWNNKHFASIHGVGSLACLLVCLAALGSYATAQEGRWPETKAHEWYAQQPWLVGSNYLPADASNELEMWQAESFDAKEIDRELGWAESLGMNTMRVFLHDLLWQQDSAGFTKRMDEFLAIASRHHIRPLFVLFDSCWDPYPKLGPQQAPQPGVHNSRWVQSPGADAMADPAQEPRLKAYVQGVVGAFANDPRVLGWDVWNEPDNTNDSSYGKVEFKGKVDRVLVLLPKVFAWAREAKPTQPLTSGVWRDNWSPSKPLSAINQIQLESSDVISFHNYGWPEEFERVIQDLEAYNRPILCTEYMARGAGSIFDTVLPVARKYHVGAINWGFVQGKSQTWLPWDSWQRPYVGIKPTVWFHDVLLPDGTPYREREAQIIRELTGHNAEQRAAKQ